MSNFQYDVEKAVQESRIYTPGAVKAIWRLREASSGTGDKTAMSDV
jgi:hypothetical protein